MHILDSLTSSSKKYQWRSKIIGEILHENMVQCCSVACEWLSRECTYRFKVEYINDNNNYNSIVSCRHCTKTVFFRMRTAETITRGKQSQSCTFVLRGFCPPRVREYNNITCTISTRRKRFQTHFAQMRVLPVCTVYVYVHHSDLLNQAVVSIIDSAYIVVPQRTNHSCPPNPRAYID